MNAAKHIFPLVGMAAAGGFAFTSCSDKAPVSPDGRPNIMFILAEDMTLDLGCYGRTDVRTPNLDRLAAEGVVYTNARCVAPLSSPTRSSMMTGLHHTITGSHNHRSNHDVPLPDRNVRPFTAYLRDAGYTCILGNRDCFENPITHNDHESSRKLDLNFKFENVGPYDGVRHFGLFDKLYDIMPEDAPFFSQITLYNTHRGDWWKSIRAQSEHPVNPAEVVLPPYLADHPKVREEFACYLDQVEYMDSQFGMVMRQMEDKGLLDNTIVIFIADNGRADLRAKGFMYEDGTKIPMIVWGKGISHAVVDDLVSELDIPATILKLAGVELPEYYQGRPLDLFNSPEEQNGGHDWLYLARDTWDEIFECIRGVHTGRYTYVRNYMPHVPYDPHHMYQEFYRPALHVMRKLRDEGKLDEAQMLFFAESKPVEELYDYLADPFCLHNLAGEPEMLGVLNEMRGLMDSWQAVYPDRGIEDRLTRKLAEDRLDENRPRPYVQKYYPEEWKKIEEGEIVDKYDIWKIEQKKMREAENNRAKVN